MEQFRSPEEIIDLITTDSTALSMAIMFILLFVFGVATALSWMHVRKKYRTHLLSSGEYNPLKIWNPVVNLLAAFATGAYFLKENQAGAYLRSINISLEDTYVPSETNKPSEWVAVALAASGRWDEAAATIDYMDKRIMSPEIQATTSAEIRDAIASKSGAQLSSYIQKAAVDTERRLTIMPLLFMGAASLVVFMAYIVLGSY